MSKSNLIFAVFLSLFFIGCVHQSPIVVAETQPPHWHPRITVDQTIVPHASKVEMKFKDPNLEFQMHPYDSGSWTTELSDAQLEELLAGEDSKSYTVEIKLEVHNSKGQLSFETKTVEILIKRPLQEFSKS